MVDTMISVEEALTRIVGAMNLLPSEVISLGDCDGRVLAEDVEARLTQPPFDISAMDGYAVHGADVGAALTTLTQIGEVAAGGAFETDIPRGSCVRIFTGGRVPDSVDTVIMQENVEAKDDQITILKAATPRQNVRDAGTDFRAGEVTLHTGKRLNARDISLLAAMNVPSVAVARKPKVAILATGDELVRPGDPLGPNQIVGSNSYGLAAFVRKWGGEPVDIGIAKDTEEDLLRIAGGTKGCDFLVTLGGASVGDHDLIQKVLAKDGLEVEFWKIAMKPGKPLIFGSYGAMPMIGLPGNPVSALVCAFLYLKPALLAMQGLKGAKTVNVLQSAILAQDLKANGPRQDHMRARIEPNSDGEAVAHPFSQQDSSQLLNFANADCLIVRPPNAVAASKGERVQIIRLD
jgi:molybdopterin molybdotransferase